MKLRWLEIHAALLLAILVIAGGCKSTTTTSQGSTPPPRQRGGGGGDSAEQVTLNPLDPCPERLHNLAGALLDFLVKYDRLPPTLEDLSPLGQTPLETTCPMTKQKYIYNPSGIKLPPARWAIVYDAAPSHSGMRWVIAFSQGKEGQPPVPAVISIREADFRAASEMPGVR